MRRTRVLLALLLAVLVAGTAYASFFDFEQITVDNTAAGKSLTAAKIPASFVYGSCRLRTAEISYLTADPTLKTVTTSVGTLLEPGETIVFMAREEALNFRAIRTGSTSGQLDCTYKYTAAP